jgi:hypothetical protein
LTAILLMAGIAACASPSKQQQTSSYPVPDQPGIYALNGTELRRLDGDPNWEATTWSNRSNLASNTQFIVSDPSLVTRAPGSVELWRVAWVRSEINAANQAMPVNGNVWDVAPITAYSVPIRYDSPRNKPSVVRITPTVPLSPGLYTIRINEPGARQARLGVGWDSLDQRQYSAVNCVDRYVAEGVYRPCNAAIIAQPMTVVPNDALVYSPGVSVPVTTTVLGLPTTQNVVVAPATVVPVPAPVQAGVTYPGLNISMAEPMRRNNGLLVQGTVTNTTNQVQMVPALQATLQDSTGRDVQRWVFQPSANTLAPGARAAFQTEVRPVSNNISTVVVGFAR